VTVLFSNVFRKFFDASYPFVFLSGALMFSRRIIVLSLSSSVSPSIILVIVAVASE